MKKLTFVTAMIAACNIYCMKKPNDKLLQTKEYSEKLNENNNIFISKSGLVRDKPEAQNYLSDPQNCKGRVLFDSFTGIQCLTFYNFSTHEPFEDQLKSILHESGIDSSNINDTSLYIKETSQKIKKYFGLVEYSLYIGKYWILKSDHAFYKLNKSSKLCSSNKNINPDIVNGPGTEYERMYLNRKINKSLGAMYLLGFSALVGSVYWYFKKN